jgi:hypothetical protein
MSPSTLSYRTCTTEAALTLTQREREREGKWGVEVRETTVEGGVGNNNFRFEGSQALPASPSDKGVA